MTTDNTSQLQALLVDVDIPTDVCAALKKEIARLEFKTKTLESDVEFYEERYRQQRDNFSMLWHVVIKDAPQVWEKIKDQLIDMSPGERDKTLSWAMRCREMQIERDAALRREELAAESLLIVMKALGIDPGDWSHAPDDIKALIESNLGIGTRTKTRDDWTDYPEGLEGTITGYIFDLLKRAEQAEAQLHVFALTREGYTLELNWHKGQWEAGYYSDDYSHCFVEEGTSPAMSINNAWLALQSALKPATPAESEEIS